jgi:hypothetical protein
MYLDTGHASTNRDSWKFTYLGSDLLPYVQKLVSYYAAVEDGQRKLMAQFMNDRTISTTGKKVENCKKLIADAGMQHEKCIVFSHEFSRLPTREYHLTLADVVYFGIAGQRAEIEVDDNE